MEQNFLEIGKIVNTHGLKGDVKVVPWSDYPEIFEKIKYVFLDGEKLKITSVKYQKSNLILRLDKINSIDDAEKIKGKILSVLKSDLGQLPQNTYFVADLIGLEAFCENEKIGVLKDVIPVSGADVYVIKREGEKDILIPATKENILEINTRQGFIKISIPNGLLD